MCTTISIHFCTALTHSVSLIFCCCDIFFCSIIIVWVGLWESGVEAHMWPDQGAPRCQLHPSSHPAYSWAALLPPILPYSSAALWTVLALHFVFHPGAFTLTQLQDSCFIWVASFIFIGVPAISFKCWLWYTWALCNSLCVHPCLFGRAAVACGWNLGFGGGLGPPGGHIYMLTTGPFSCVVPLKLGRGRVGSIYLHSRRRTLGTCRGLSAPPLGGDSSSLK